MASMTTHELRSASDNNMNLFTLIFLKYDDKLLLGMKKRGFGVGKWNGFGGKVHKNESIEQGAIRELEEECGVVITREDLRYLGYVMYVDFHNVRLVHIFTVSMQPETCYESEEMLPKWFKFKEIPYQQMWPDCEYWIPYVLTDSKLRATFIYGNNEEIVYKQVDVILD